MPPVRRSFDGERRHGLEPGTKPGGREDPREDARRSFGAAHPARHPGVVDRGLVERRTEPLLRRTGDRGPDLFEAKPQEACGSPFGVTTSVAMLQAQAVYDSVWHIPVSAWVGSVVGILLARHRRGFARVYGVAFALASALDAWLNGPLTPLASGGLAATVSGIVFVILGDLRFFVASERLERGAAARWLTPLAWSLLVPVLCEVVRRAVPAIAANERATFLSYELLFLPVALYFRRRAARARDAPRAWPRSR